MPTGESSSSGETELQQLVSAARYRLEGSTCMNFYLLKYPMTPHDTDEESVP